MILPAECCAPLDLLVAAENHRGISAMAAQTRRLLLGGARKP